MEPADERRKRLEAEAESPTVATCAKRFTEALHSLATEATAPLAWLALAAFVAGMVFGGLALDHLPPQKI
ncbi:hypothetical protein D3C72_2494610 [compost metagenome]